MHNKNPKNVIMNLCECTVPSMRYSKNQDFFVWQKTAREKLIELLGTENISFAEKDDFTISDSTDCITYTDTYFSFQSENGFYVPCHILIPKSVNQNTPTLLCLQGHTTGMHISIGTSKFDDDAEDISSGDRDYALTAVNKGYIAIAIEQRYMGECGGTDEGPTCIHRSENSIDALPALLFGRTAIGERVFDVTRLIDLICKNSYDLFKFVDENNIFITGNSGGGTTSFYAACVDERIKVCIPSCSICTFKDSIIDLKHCCCNYIPSIAKYFDMGDLAGLIAPRKLIIVAGEKDSIFPISGVKQTFSFAENLYSCINAENNLSLLIGNGGHRYYKDLVFNKLAQIQNL